MRKTIRYGAWVSLAFTLALCIGCAHKPYVVHPGSINTFDSRSADSLAIYQADLTQAKQNIIDGAWPASFGEYVDKAGQGYDTALASYKTWRDVAVGVKTGDAAALQAQFSADLTNLANQISALFAKAGQKVPVQQ